jgi:hypothetical protein
MTLFSGEGSKDHFPQRRFWMVPVLPTISYAPSLVPAAVVISSIPPAN